MDASGAVPNTIFAFAEPSVMEHDLPPKRFDFTRVVEAITSEHIHVVPTAATRIGSIADLVTRAMGSPVDFPPLLKAMVPGDRIALAVSADVPELAELLGALVDRLASIEPESIDIVIDEEIRGDAYDLIASHLGTHAHLHIHRSEDRSELRFLGPDVDAEPIYLDRILVDADVVVPITTDLAVKNASSAHSIRMLASFADSWSRRRELRRLDHSDEFMSADDSHVFMSTLGVQALMSVASDSTGRISEVNVGTLSGLSQRMAHALDIDRTSSIVVAMLDGESSQQSWLNAARAIQAAGELLSDGGTIVLWSAITQDPPHLLIEMADRGSDSVWMIRQLTNPDESENGFPRWDSRDEAAVLLAQSMNEFRVLFRAEMNRERIEAAGLVSIDSLAELRRLTRSFTNCTVLRAASISIPNLNRTTRTSL
jgi:hypothetical protein